MGAIDWHRVAGPLELRNWRPGDHYQPVGTAAPEKIKTFFQEFQIPLWERRHWPVLTDGPSIVWARRFGPAIGFAAAPDCPVTLNVREMRIAPDESGVYKGSKARRED
jgi:tRNA(Ile)-lysidine synthetase-like protein